ncbi:hypothetical protein KUF71_018723 [Frankliniella fusca]|uniref:Uncharacterized protein n=1 Tax=Frankliniella fusca TaxID=407009 RepID=A0AAE1L6L1_9NEOP|nr:hypothetical protein KUF71_018723 [Frankliniella fusca]
MFLIRLSLVHKQLSRWVNLYVQLYNCYFLGSDKNLLSIKNFEFVDKSCIQGYVRIFKLLCLPLSLMGGPAVLNYFYHHTRKGCLSLLTIYLFVLPFVVIASCSTVTMFMKVAKTFS